MGGSEDIAKIARVVAELPSLMSRASTGAADLLEDVIEQQFAQGHDPYGEPWAPLRPSTLKRGRTPPPLTDSGALAAVEVEPLQSAGVRVTFAEDYAGFHQSGTSRMAQRRIVPDESTWQKSLWYPAIVEAYSNAILKNGGWRAAGADVSETYDVAAE